MMDENRSLREHLTELLDSRSAHVDLDAVVNGFPMDKINTTLSGSPHTAWQLLEHIRIAQWDILDFSTNSGYKELEFPGDYWPAEDGTAASWEASVEQIRHDLQAMRDLVNSPSTDLYARIPHGNGQTILREALLVADHNAYHLGQLMLLRKMLEA